MFEDVEIVVWRGNKEVMLLLICKRFGGAVQSADYYCVCGNAKLLPTTDTASTSTGTSHQQAEQEPLHWLNGSVRVQASLPLGVLIGNGRGKLLPMRACGRGGYTRWCRASFQARASISYRLLGRFLSSLVTRFILPP
jgi:hypothetical protein